MLGRAETLKTRASEAGQLATDLAQDPKFRKKLVSALGHGAQAQRRARWRVGYLAAAAKLASDEELRTELRAMANDLRDAWGRVDRKQSHTFRNLLFLLIGGGAIAFAATKTEVRQWIMGRAGGLVPGGGTMPRVIDAEIEVDVPVTTAYNQWTQFEEFPQFMEGVEQVTQLDDTRVHWVANVAGKRAEWDAKILEQHPDQQISWISEDGKKTRGTVTFESLGQSRTRVHLSMSYQAEGLAEAAGSAAGLDTRRVRGDLERFKDLIESRRIETGSWRGEVSEGETS